jgi:hypothetical protein
MEDMEFLKAMLAKMNANQEKAEASWKADCEALSEMMKSNQEKVEANRKADCEVLKEMMDANTKAIQEEILARMDASKKAVQKKMDRHQENMEAWIVDKMDGQKETMACKEMMEAYLECKEPTSMDMESEAEHREVPEEDPIVKPVEGQRNRRRDRNLATERCQKMKEGGPGILWIPEESDPCQQEDDLLCKSCMGKKELHQERSHQEAG